MQSRKKFGVLRVNNMFFLQETERFQIDLH